MNERFPHLRRGFCIAQTNMKYHYLVLTLLSLSFVAPTSAKTRYSGEFDYRDFEPSTVYFHGHTRAEIDHLCNTGEHASTEDMEECEHREFERTVETLNRKITALTTQIKKDDSQYAKPDDEPVALPYFLKSQAAWVQYRDNYCYSYVYDLGPGTAKYIYFFECMTAMTKERTNQLAHFNE